MKKNLIFVGGSVACAGAAIAGGWGLLGLVSTGTAIPTLRGAALTSASLASIGGGTMAAGSAVITAAGAGVGASSSAAIFARRKKKTKKKKC